MHIWSLPSQPSYNTYRLPTHQVDNLSNSSTVFNNTPLTISSLTLLTLSVANLTDVNKNKTIKDSRLHPCNKHTHAAWPPRPNNIVWLILSHYVQTWRRPQNRKYIMYCINVPHCHQRTEIRPRPQATSTENFVKSGHVALRYASRQQTCWSHYSVQSWRQSKNKLAPYGTDGRLFTTDVSDNFKVMWHKN